MEKNTINIDCIINQILDNPSNEFSMWINHSLQIVGISYNHKTMVLINLNENTVEIQNIPNGFEAITSCIKNNSARIIQMGKVYYKGYDYGALMYD